MSMVLKLANLDFPRARHRSDLPGDTPVSGSSESDVIEVRAADGTTFPLGPDDWYWETFDRKIGGPGFGEGVWKDTYICDVLELNIIGYIGPDEFKDMAALRQRWTMWDLEFHCWAGEARSAVRHILGVTLDDHKERPPSSVLHPGIAGPKPFRSIVTDRAYLLNENGKTIDKIGHTG